MGSSKSSCGENQRVVDECGWTMTRKTMPKRLGELEVIRIGVR
jgi:hypothetical protein